VLVSAGLAIGLGLLFLLDAERLSGSRGGRIAILIGLGCLPLFALGGGTAHAVHESSSTEFCLNCHEMTPYGQSLFVEDTKALPAAHYQSRLIDRDHVCYACHKDYGLLGDFKAKLTGLNHVYVHFLGEIPETFELYSPYPNSNCLYCHDDARSFLDSAGHRGQVEQFRKGRTSCLTCHAMGHGLDQVKAGEFWLANP